MESTDVCVLHVAGDAGAESLQGIVQALAQLGLHQVMLPLRPGFPARSPGGAYTR